MQSTNGARMTPSSRLAQAHTVTRRRSSAKTARSNRYALAVSVMCKGEDMSAYEAQTRELELIAIGRTIAQVKTWDSTRGACATFIFEDGGALTFCAQVAMPDKGLAFYWQEAQQQGTLL